MGVFTFSWATSADRDVPISAEMPFCLSLEKNAFVSFMKGKNMDKLHVYSSYVP